MARKKKEYKKSAAQSVPVPSIPAQPLWAPGYFFTHQFRWQALFIFVLGFIFYANSIPGEYALDDGLVIKENKWVQQGVKGIGKILSHGELDYFYEKQGSKEQFTGGRYRPLSIVTFAIEQSVFGDNPHVRHFFNTLYYCITLVLMLYFLRKYVFPDNPDIAFLATLLFAIHPVHSEVVANIKSRNELFPFLFYLLTLIYSAKAIDSKKIAPVFLACVFLFLSLLSKEYGILMIVLLPLFFYLVHKVSLKQSLLASIPYWLTIGIYVLIRISITKATNLAQPASEEVMNNQYVLATFSEKIATKIYLLSNYLGILIFPVSLRADYSYNQIPFIPLDNLKFICSLLLYTGIVAFTVFLFLRKKFTAVFFMLFYLAHLFIISNLAVEIGTTFSERLIYIASFPFCIGLAWLILAGLEKIPSATSTARQYGLLTLLLVVTVLSALKVTARNALWKNDFTLFTHDVALSTNSVLVNSDAGKSYLDESQKPEIKGTQLEKEYIEKGIFYLNKAIAIYPKFPNGYSNLGVAFFYQGKYEEAFKNWMKAKEYHRNDPALKDYAVVLTNNALIKGTNKDYLGAIQFLEYASQLDETNAEIWYNLGGAYYTVGNYEMAKKSWEYLLTSLNPNHQKAREGYSAVVNMLNAQQGKMPAVGKK